MIHLPVAPALFIGVYQTLLAICNKKLTSCFSSGVRRGRDETPRADRHRRSKSVQFASDDGIARANSPDDRRHRRHHRDRDYDSAHSDISASDSEGHDRHHRRDGHRRRDRDHDRRRRDPSPTQSDTTEDPPDRFDKHGRRKQEKADAPGDVIADKIEELLSGKGSAGKLIKNLTDNFLGGGDKKR